MNELSQTPVMNSRFLSKPVDTKALLSAIAELGALPQDRNGSDERIFMDA